MVTRLQEAGVQLGGASPWTAAVPALFHVHHLQRDRCLLNPCCPQRPHAESCQNHREQELGAAGCRIATTHSWCTPCSWKVVATTDDGLPMHLPSLYSLLPVVTAFKITAANGWLSVPLMP